MDLQQLINEATPGSIWLRTDGSRARVLAITNLSLPTESQQKYVPVVVYIGPSGKVLSRPLKDFAGYFPTWIGHDASAEKVIKSLLTPLSAPKVEVASPEDDSIDMSDDAPSVQAAPRAKPAVQVRDKAALATVAVTGNYNDLVNRPAPPPVLLRAAFQIGSDPVRKTPTIAADRLSQSIRVYSQVPDEHLGLIVHKLSFELSPTLTIDHLKEVFSPDEWVNTVDAFRIGTPVSDETVNVDAYIGVYPEYTRNVLYGTVYVGVDMIPVSNQALQSHVHTEITATHASAPDEVQPEVVSPKPEETQVPSADPVDEAPYTEEVAAVEAATPSAEPVPQPEAGEVGVQALPEGAVVAESGAPEPEASVQPVKVRKKRGPKKKVVEAALPVADDDLDVNSLS
jgi:hypothetical protein